MNFKLEIIIGRLKLLITEFKEMMKKGILFISFVGLIAISMNSHGQTNETVRLRGVIEKLDGNAILLKERSGEKLRIEMPENLVVREVYPIGISEIQQNSFIGVTALPDTENRLVAVEVHVFPEAMQGQERGIARGICNQEVR